MSLAAFLLATAVALQGDIAVQKLPSEARQTLALIEKSGPFPYPRDGAGRAGEVYYTDDHYRSFRRIIRP